MQVWGNTGAVFCTRFCGHGLGSQDFVLTRGGTGIITFYRTPLLSLVICMSAFILLAFIVLFFHLGSNSRFPKINAVIMMYAYYVNTRAKEHRYKLLDK